MEKQTGVFHLLYGVRLYWPGEEGLKKPSGSRTIYKLIEARERGIIEFIFLPLSLSLFLFLENCDLIL